MSVQISFEIRRQRLSKRVEVLSTSASIDRHRNPMLTGTICWVGIGNEQFRSIALRQVVAAVDTIEL